MDSSVIPILKDAIELGVIYGHAWAEIKRHTFGRILALEFHLGTDIALLDILTADGFEGLDRVTCVR